MSQNRFFRIVLFAICLGSVAVAETPAPSQGVLPITTKSAPARQLFVGGLVKLQNLHGPEAMQDLHKAIQLDPDFALANIMISSKSEGARFALIRAESPAPKGHPDTLQKPK